MKNYHITEGKTILEGKKNIRTDFKTTVFPGFEILRSFLRAKQVEK